MTVGNISTPFPSTDPYGIEVGESFSRSWSGGDRSAADKQAGRYPPHDYNTTRTRRNYALTKWSISNSYVWYSQSSYWAGLPPAPSNPYTAAEQNALINKLYGTVKGSDFNLAVSAAQLNQTIGMFGACATKIFRAYSAARKGNFSAAAVALTGRERGPRNKVASNWLELQYGWLPLLSDVHDGAEWLAATLHRQPPMKVRVRKTYKAFGEQAPNAPFRFGSIEREVRAQILATIEPKDALSLTQSSGLTDPFSVAWELVPYSFVIDWFLPLGDFLQAASATRSLKGTFQTTVTDRFSVRGLYSGKGYHVQGGESHLYDEVTVARTLSSTLDAKFPGFKPLGKALSLRHTLNAIALLGNLKR